MTPLAQVAKYFDVPVEQIVGRPAAKFVFDQKAELPIRVQKLQPMVVSFFNDWGKPKHIVYKDIDRYQIYDVLQDLYEHVRLQHPDAPSLFARCTSGQPMLQTYEKLGSLHYCQLGTCFVKTDSEAEGYVILDAAVLANEIAGQIVATDRMSMSQPVPAASMVSTGSTMVTIPIAAGDRYRILKRFKDYFDDEAPQGVMPWITGQWDVGVEIPEGLGVVKWAVEIDRSLLGQGNTIFFEPVDVCHNICRVWDRLRDIDSESCDGTKLVAAEANCGIGPRFYILMPKAMDVEDLPMNWECDQLAGSLG